MSDFNEEPGQDDLSQLANAAQSYVPHRVIARRSATRSQSVNPLVYIAPQSKPRPFAAGFFGALGAMAAISVVAIILRAADQAATPATPASPATPPAPASAYTPPKYNIYAVPSDDAAAAGTAHAGTVYVKGYFRADGSYVAPHWRRAD